MRLALIKNGFVINVVESDMGLHSDFTEIESDAAGVGDSWNGENFIPVQGEITAPVEPVNQKVLTVSCFQAKVALEQSGLLDSVEAIMIDPATPKKIKLAWNNGTTFKRYSDMVTSMAALLGLTDGQIDNLFSLAATIE